MILFVRVVVTGGAGFIGSHLVDALVHRGDDVAVVDDLSVGTNINPDVELVVQDVRAPMTISADVIFHLAAQADVPTSVREPVHDASVNIVGTVNMLTSGARVVFASTGGAIYGECDGPATEGYPLRPVSPYGVSKLCAERYVAHMGGVVLRFANVYGPRQSCAAEGGVVSIFLDRLSAGEPVMIFGDGQQTRDFVYVGDVVDALLAAADVDSGTYNIGTGRETTVVDLFRVCADELGVEAEPVFAPPRPGDVYRSVIDPGLAGRVLGWRARTSLSDGVYETIS